MTDKDKIFKGTASLKIGSQSMRDGEDVRDRIKKYIIRDQRSLNYFGRFYYMVLLCKRNRGERLHCLRGECPAYIDGMCAYSKQIFDDEYFQNWCKDMNVMCAELVGTSDPGTSFASDEMYSILIEIDMEAFLYCV